MEPFEVTSEGGCGMMPDGVPPLAVATAMPAAFATAVPVGQTARITVSREGVKKV